MAGLEDLFGKRGACNGCWCMWPRIGRSYHGNAAQNKRAFRAVVKQGPPPGLLAFKDDLCVGWCQVTPRAAVPWLDRVRHLKRVDDVGLSVRPSVPARPIMRHDLKRISR